LLVAVAVEWEAAKAEPLTQHLVEQVEVVLLL
jgi:hypothetical protein